MIIDTHPFFVWMPFGVASALLVMIFTIVPKEARSLSLVTLGGFIWMFTVWLLMIRYPSFGEMVALPYLLILAVTVVGAFVWLQRLGKRMGADRSAHG